MAPNKLEQALKLRRDGCELKIITDSVESAEAIQRFGQEQGERFEVWIEIDVDGHRSGVAPEDDVLLHIGRVLHDGGMHLGGVLAHAESSYEYGTQEALERTAESSAPVACARRKGCARRACRAIS